MTATESFDHFEFAVRSAIVIGFVFVMAYLLEYFDSDRGVEA